MRWEFEMIGWWWVLCVVYGVGVLYWCVVFCRRIWCVVLGLGVWCLVFGV